jgi:hypothetical protein
MIPDLEMRAAEALQNFLAADPFVVAQKLDVFRFDKAPSEPSGPMVIITASGGDEIAPRSGVYRLEISVQVLSAFGEPEVDDWHNIRTYGVRSALSGDSLRAALEAGGPTGGLKVYSVTVKGFNSNGSDKFLLSETTLEVVASAPSDEERKDAGNFGSPPERVPVDAPAPIEAHTDAPDVGISAARVDDPDKWFFTAFNVAAGDVVELRANIPNALNARCEWSAGGVALPWGNGSVIRLPALTIADSAVISCRLVFDKKAFQLDPFTLTVQPPGVPVTNAPHFASPRPKGAKPTASKLEFKEDDGLFAIGMGDLRGNYPLCRYVSASGTTYIWGAAMLLDGWLLEGQRRITLCAVAKSSIATEPGYAWKRDGETIQGARGAMLDVTTTGAYTVNVTDGKNTLTGSITIT